MKKCEDCNIELADSEEDVCDRCDFMRNYPEIPEAEVDGMRK